MNTPRGPSPRPDDEPARQAAFDALQITDSADPFLDAVTELAALTCEMPIAMVTMIDRTMAWPKSAYGIQGSSVDRGDSFSARILMDPDSVFLVPDASRDPIFHAYPAVEGGRGLRSYAGVPS